MGKNAVAVALGVALVVSTSALSGRAQTVAEAAEAGAIAWTRNYTDALTRAAEKRQAVLMHFRQSCGTTTAPGTFDTRGRPVHDTERNPCDRMQQDVWEADAIRQSVRRFIPVLVDGGDMSLNTRYQVVRMPTTLVTDPWGNEIVRTSGYLERTKMQRLLDAMPRDFAALSTAGATLQAKPHDFEALGAVARFYETARLPQVVERLYGLALATPRDAVKLDLWRQAVVARGLNLMMGLSDPGQAASVFEREIAAASEAEGTPALWLGVVNARLQQGKRKEAEAAVKTLEERWPKSAWATRARQNLSAK